MRYFVAEQFFSPVTRAKGGGGEPKDDMMTRGRGGAGGGLDTPKSDDIIYEQPLTGSKPEMLFENILRFGHVKFSRKNLTTKWWVIFS